MLIRAWVSADLVWRFEQWSDLGWRIEMHGAVVAERLGSRELVDRRLAELGAPPLTEMRGS